MECNNEKCENASMELENEDSRQEWYEAYYICERCGQRKIHKMEFNQLGLVTKDVISEEK